MKLRSLLLLLLFIGIASVPCFGQFELVGNYYTAYGKDRDGDFSKKKKHWEAQYYGNSLYEYAKSVAPIFKLNPVIRQDTIILLSLESPCADDSYWFKNSVETLIVVPGDYGCPVRKYTDEGYRPNKYYDGIKINAKYWGTILSAGALNDNIFSIPQFINIRDALYHYLGFVKSNDGLYYSLKEQDVIDLVNEYKKLDSTFATRIIGISKLFNAQTQSTLINNYLNSEYFTKIGTEETRKIFKGDAIANLEKVWQNKRIEINKTVNDLIASNKYFEAYTEIEKVGSGYPFKEEMAEMKCLVANGYLEMANGNIFKIKDYMEAKRQLDFVNQYCPTLSEDVKSLFTYMTENPLMVFINNSGYGADIVSQRLETSLKRQGFNTTHDLNAKNIIYSVNISMVRFDQPEPVVERNEKTFYLKQDCYKTVGYGSTKKTEKGVEATTPVKVVFLDSRRVNYYEYNVLITQIQSTGNLERFNGGFYSKKPDEFRSANTDYNWGKLTKLKMECSTGWGALIGLGFDAASIVITAIGDKKEERTKDSNTKLFNEAATEIANAMTNKFLEANK